ncbi:MAG: type II secretion system F family protein [Candidatus Saccharibacteria bacterium]|nr:type II secretion system F family protein [Candidatus Saccharibacteria bacterium]
MRTFNYQARDNRTNKIVKSTVKAETEIAAGKLLLDQNLIPLQITEASDDGFFSRSLNRITLKDKVVFSRQLSTLIGAGLPLTQALRTVEEQTENKAFRTVITDIVTSVEGGKTLAESFAQHPEVFDKLYLALINAGEISGTLDNSLKRIALQQEKDAAMMSKIKGAMTYPSIVLVVIILVMTFLLLQVVPQVDKLYRDMKKNLPFVTQVMVGLTNFIIHYWWLVLIAAGVGIFFLVRYFRTESGGKMLDSLKLNVPVFKHMFRKLYMARFMRTGGMLLETGVSMLDTLDIAAEAVNNTLVAKSIRQAAEKVQGGKALSASLKDRDYILPLVHQMISIGEQSGKISEMMDKTAQVYEDELDEEIKAISTAIEPILMVTLAVVAGVMVAAILLPIYSLVNDIH